MHDPVPQTVNLPPWYLRMFFLKSPVNLLGYLTYLAEIENAGFYQHRVVDKVRIADSLAVAAYGIDHSQHFLNNDLIPHRC